MKRIIFSVFLFVSLIYNVSAKEIYYSDYSETRVCSTKRQELSELVNVEVERRYRFYRNHIEGEYRSLLEDNSNFEFVDWKKQVDGEYSSWSTEIPSNNEKRIIESKTVYTVKRPKPIKDFYIINTGASYIQLKNIDIYFDGKKLNYDASKETLEGWYVIRSYDSLKLSLDKYYDLQKLTIQIDEAIFSVDNDLQVYATVPSSDNTYFINYFQAIFDNSHNKDIIISTSDWVRANTQYEEEVVLEYKPNEPLSIVSETKYYRYQDPLFYFYNTYKNYIDGYFVEYPEFIKDENDYVDFYCVRTREKLEISEEIEITDYNQKISDFINSTVNYKINGEVNLDNNGIYSVEILTDFITLNKDIVVNINENILDDINNHYDEIEKTLNETKEKYEQSVKDLNDLKKETDKLKSDKTKLKTNNNRLNEEINSLTEVNENLKQNILKKELEGKICNLNLERRALEYEDINKIDKKNIGCLVLIFLILLVILLIFLKNLSNKNKF